MVLLRAKRKECDWQRGFSRSAGLCLAFFSLWTGGLGLAGCDESQKTGTSPTPSSSASTGGPASPSGARGGEVQQHSEVLTIKHVTGGDATRGMALALEYQCNRCHDDSG